MLRKTEQTRKQCAKHPEDAFFQRIVPSGLLQGQGDEGRVRKDQHYEHQELNGVYFHVFIGT